ncbi:MAG TPA: aspartate--tRNA(Asn) ligase [Candidatus Paceibacterota bacterium]|nr:aspartate--tRNA(Asn) ligase [Candidatus Paceibacterota bacterium]
MQRIMISDLSSKKGEEVLIKCWVDVRRDQGKMVFFDFRDMSGKVQGVVLPGSSAIEIAKEVRDEFVVAIKGKVNERPERNRQADKINGDIELEVLEIEIITKAQDLPFALDSELNLDTLLDYRPYTLRRAREQAIFKVQHNILLAFREFLIQKGFKEFRAPAIVGGDAEGGTEVFKFDYFYGHTGYLATSPQLYKQMMVGVFERVFTVTNVFRAEKHSTARHLNEYTSLDLEMGFIDSPKDIMKMETELLIYVTAHLKKTCAEEFKILEANFPLIPEGSEIFPMMKLSEAQQLITKETGVDCTQEPDLSPEHERWLCEYSKKEFNSDFIFITNYPRTKRPFYAMDDEENDGTTKCFDLLFRGLELISGNQREHRYDLLVEKMKWKGLDPEKFSFYLQAFKYGIPPHGGLGMGLERLTARFLNLPNIKEATLFPRDINRIDKLLSE